MAASAGLGSRHHIKATLDEDEMASRFRTLTPRERRLLVLAVERGVNYRHIAATLGVSRGHISNTMGSIRRKLAVPPKEDLAHFVGRISILSSALAEVQHETPGVGFHDDTRRHKDLLRITLSELRAVAARAESRAHALSSLPGGPEDAAPRLKEAVLTRRIAHLLRDTLERALAEARTSEQPVQDASFAGEARGAA